MWGIDNLRSHGYGGSDGLDFVLRSLYAEHLLKTTAGSDENDNSATASEKSDYNEQVVDVVLQALMETSVTYGWRRPSCAQGTVTIVLGALLSMQAAREEEGYSGDEN